MSSSSVEAAAYALFCRTSETAPVVTSELVKAAKAAGLSDYAAATSWNHTLYSWERSELCVKVGDKAGKPLWQPTEAAAAIRGIREAQLASLLHTLEVLSAGTKSDLVGILLERVRKVGERFVEAEAMAASAVSVGSDAPAPAPAPADGDAEARAVAAGAGAGTGAGTGIDAMEEAEL